MQCEMSTIRPERQVLVLYMVVKKNDLEEMSEGRVNGKVKSPVGPWEYVIGECPTTRFYPRFTPANCVS